MTQDSSVLAEKFCQKLLKWLLSGGKRSTKKGLVQELMGILSDNNRQKIPYGVLNRALRQHGLPVVGYAIMETGSEIREDHVEDLIDRLKPHIIKRKREEPRCV